MDTFVYCHNDVIIYSPLNGQPVEVFADRCSAFEIRVNKTT